VWWRWQRELVLAMREETRMHRAELQALHAEQRALRADQQRRFDAIDAALANDKRVTREILLELRQGREMLRDIQHGIRSNTDGLLRVLDELRREDGPSAAA
jgi:predicted phage gp36 major capsid-like protein